MGNPYNAPTETGDRQIRQPMFVDWLPGRLVFSILIAAGLAGSVVVLGQILEDSLLAVIMTNQQTIAWRSLPVWFLLIHMCKYSAAAGIVTAVFAAKREDIITFQNLLAIGIAVATGTLCLFCIDRIPAMTNTTWRVPAMMVPVLMVAIFLTAMVFMSINVWWMRGKPNSLTKLVTATFLALLAFGILGFQAVAWMIDKNHDHYSSAMVTMLWTSVMSLQLFFSLKPPKKAAHKGQQETSSASLAGYSWSG